MMISANNHNCMAVSIIKSNPMNNQVDQLQASRLKQILFPRKAKPTRSLVTSAVEQSKENKQTNIDSYGYNGNRHANLRDQICKLKEGIQLFVDKHMLNENYLTTPRQCLELIKYMSDSMVNYSAEIQEAIGTLIESIPKPLPKLMPMSKYFLMGLKFSYLSSLYQVGRRRLLSQGFKEIKNEHINRKISIAKQRQRRIGQENKLDLQILNKISRAFNRWRINVHLQSKSLIQKYYIGSNQQMNSMLHMFSDQSQIILYLQKLLHSETNADAIEILLYDSKANLLRGYKTEIQNLGSVFESVREQSYISEGGFDNIDVPHSSPRRNVTKRMEMKLDHSLTKICILKRKLIAVDQMNTDPDYTSSIDDFTIFYGLSARETLGGCIFTPLIGKSGCIGLIRQYFYSKVGERPNSQTVNMLTLVLQNSIKTSQRFEEAKQKSLAIRNLYYLKAVLILNSLEKNEHEQKFYSLISQYYNIEFKVEYPYTVAETLDNIPHFTVQNKGEGDQDIPNIVAALTKMVQHQTYFLYDHQHLYFMLDSRIVIFNFLKESEHPINQSKKSNDGHLPVAIVMQLLEKKQLRRIRKQKQEEEYQVQQERIRKQQQNRRLSEKKNQILQFCMQQKNVQNQSDLMGVIEDYIQKFNKQEKLKVEIQHKKYSKNSRSSDDATILYENENLRVSLNRKVPKNQQQQRSEIFLTPLVGLCASLIDKIKKPYEITSFNHIDMKSQIHCNPENIEEGLISLIRDFMQLEGVQINIIQAVNPFTAEFYCCFIDRKDLFLQSPSAFAKSIKSSSFEPYSGLNPVVTILYLGNGLFIQIDKYLSITQTHLLKLKTIYDQWRNQRKCQEDQIKNQQKYSLYFRGFMKFNRFVIHRLQKIFYLINNCKLKIRGLPNFFQNYIHKQNRMGLNYAFSILHARKQKHLVKMSDLSSKLTKLSRTIKNISSLKDMFTFYRLNKFKCKILSNMCSILLSNRNHLLSVGFNQIYLKKNLINTNKLWTLPLIFNRMKAPAFQILKRFSKSKEQLGIIQSETECSIVSKMDSLYQIFKLVKSKFDNFEFFICLKNGAYMQLCDKKIEVVKQFRDRPNFQYFQFSSQTKSKIRNIVWLVPEAYTVSLIEKHYLQVLSRAIEEGFSKFIYKNQQFLSLVRTFILNKSKKFAQRALKNLRSFTMSKIKAEQYSLRDQFYEASIQVENFRLMQKQQCKEEQQRLKQVTQSVKMKQKYEQNLSHCRKSIVRLDISSKKLEQVEGKQRLEKQKKNLIEAFNSWRVEASFRTKYAQRRFMARKKQNFASSSLLKILKQIVLDNYRYCHQRILIESAHVRARDLSAQKKPLKQNKQQNYNQNRLLTFQDELNEFTQRDSEDRKQISIIPISFKHFEGSKKENYDVTDDDLKKMNGGAYKLNAKTLKFLKRMGKLNN